MCLVDYMARFVKFRRTCCNSAAFALQFTSSLPDQCIVSLTQVPPCAVCVLTQVLVCDVMPPVAVEELAAPGEASAVTEDTSADSSDDSAIEV